MKKPFLTLLVTFVGFFAAFVLMNIKKIDTHSAIAKAPVFVLATPEGITKKTKKLSTSYQVNYTYAVDGATYKIDTDWVKTVEQAEKMASEPVQVAFAAGKPDNGIFKTEYDTHDRSESVWGAILMAAGMGLVAAAGFTLVLLWKFPWLRR
ncbi:DUF3592 domain-containing protein [Massilia rubra]|uniref:DUF3592 domain-containing protein n=1 Tax=Massilia rubra TaxID=2607910 RepID=A0ABX0LDX4_9BURK|nr:DUF3592 domain-containing protein [Massilia rubra]NHZ33041.1 DUF3592 domain-containing protein [Massilia rubra]